jgi:ADP-ribosyl-[dinitrogen reductase] hydrolase
MATTREAAEGAVLGALAGDAAGAVLEFLGREVTPTDVDHAMGMPGGGVWRVAPGQITDDGELTMCLLRGLARGDGARRRAAERYAAWVASDPFDIGGTTAASLGALRDAGFRAIAEVHGPDVAMERAAAARCMESKANGSLMRSSPLGVWGARFDDDDVIAAAAIGDAKLSHPNASCTGAAAAYAIAIASLVRAPGDRDAAIGRARAWVDAHAEDEVRAWLADALEGRLPAFTPQDGFVRIAFTHAFAHLAKGSDWERAVRETLAGGGDTDTNACIVGGLVGAACGVGAIPERALRAVLECDHARASSPRPEWLHPREAPELVAAILAGA